MTQYAVYTKAQQIAKNATYLIKKKAIQTYFYAFFWQSNNSARQLLALFCAKTNWVQNQLGVRPVCASATIITGLCKIQKPGCRALKKY